METSDTSKIYFFSGKKPSTRFQPTLIQGQWYTTGEFLYQYHKNTRAGCVRHWTLKNFLYVDVGWVAESVQKQLQKVSDAFTAIKVFGILTI